MKHNIMYYISYISSYRLFLLNFGCSKQAFPLRTATPPAKKQYKKSGAKRPEPQIMPRSRSSPTTTHIRGVDEVWSRSGIDWGEGLEGELDLSFFCPQASSFFWTYRWLMVVSKWCFELGSGSIHKKTPLWHNWRLFSLGLLHLIQIPGETWHSWILSMDWLTIFIKMFQYIPDVLPFNLVHIDQYTITVSYTIIYYILANDATTCHFIRSYSSSFDVSSAAIVFGVC